MRFAWVGVLLSGCTLYFGPGDPPSSTDDVAPPDAGSASPGPCSVTHTATIFAPLDGATYDTTVVAHVRWNEPGIQARLMSMADHYSHYFMPTSGPGDGIQGDGSEIHTYELPAGGSYVFEIGWYCDVSQPPIVLAHVEFQTQP